MSCRMIDWGAVKGVACAAACAAVYAAACAGARAETCEALQALKFDQHVTVTAAHLVVRGSALLPGPAATEAAAPVAQFDYCRVQATSRPSADSDIRFEVWIPVLGSWNGKFEQVGNGGFAGAIDYGLMAYVLSLGYAVAGTDDGHRSSDGTDASWALNHPERVKDYGWRAIDETARASKKILFRATSRPPAKSYFVGCSDGGREALMMAQRFPGYFDGILAGAPLASMTRVFTGAALRSAELGGTISRFSATQLTLLQNHVLQGCGNGATYLQDPRRCHVDLTSLQCTGVETESCLSAAQIATARAIYADATDPVSARPLYGRLPGAEGVKNSWDTWITGRDNEDRAAGTRFTWNYFAYLVMNDAKFHLATLTTADFARGERRLAPIIDADSPDLSAFKARGGKLLHYHGWNDPAIPPGYSVEYRERMTAKTGDVSDFYRLYMVPGMLHCGGGDAPTAVTWQSVLEDWVEKAVAPGNLIATDTKGRTQTLEPFNEPYYPRPKP